MFLSPTRTPTQASVALRIILAVAIALFPMVPPASAAFEPVQKSTSLRVVTNAKDAPESNGNYDVRDDKSKQDVLDRYREKAGKDRGEKINEKKARIRAAKDKLAGAIPGLEILDNRHTGAPEIVGTSRGRQKLTGKSSKPPEQIARDFLQDNADLYGLSQREIAQLKKIADYRNPRGGLSWVEYKQEVNGLPLFQGELRLAINEDGELARTTGNLVPALEDFPSPAGKTGLVPAVSAMDAVMIAATSIGVAIPGGLSLKEVSADETTWIFSPGPFTDDVKVSLEYFPIDAGVLTLAWTMILYQEEAAYYTYVSAEDGELLWRKNIVDSQTQPATYSVYTSDSPAPFTPSTSTPAAPSQAPLVPRSLQTLISEHPLNDPWLPDGSSTTIGNNVDAGLDLVSPDGIEAATRPVSATRNFIYAYNPAPGDPAPGDAPTLPDYRAGEVVQMFFWSNRYHDRLYELGFTEAARNFQQNNYGRGGLGNDRVLAQGQDFSGTNNANMLTPPDGSSGRMQMYIFTGPTPDRTSGLDQEIVIHELTHGTSNRLHSNASGLSANASRGMGEGWSDFYSRALLATADEDINGIYGAGGYSTLAITGPSYTTNYYYGIRRFPYALISSLGPNGKPYNPMTLADIDAAKINLTDGAYPRGPIGSSSAHAVHNIGEVWCSMLLEVRARLIARMGFEAGNQRMLQLVTDGMKLDPANPTLLDGRNAILAASAATGGGAQEEMDIWAGFAVRGAGYGATVTAAATTPITVTESFNMPNLVIEDNPTIVADSCDNGGYADPGETVVLAVRFTNPLASDINDGVATVGGQTLSLGPIAAGQTITANFTLVIPSNASCGSAHAIAASVTTSRGTNTKTLSLRLGLETGVIPRGTFSSGNLATPLPDLVTTDIPINVTASGNVDRTRVSLRLNHTGTGDLVVSLIAPDGTSVTLFNRRGSFSDNLGSGANDCSGTQTTFDDSAAAAISAGVSPFNGTFRPETPLAALRGREMNGLWKLRVADVDINDFGVFGCVTVEFTDQLSYCCGVPGIPVINAAPPATLVSECGSAANGAPDPGELVTMNFPIRNVGSGLTTNLVGTLRNTAMVTSTGGPQTYGILSPAAAGAVAKPFSFSVSSAAACGSDIVCTIDFTDGGTPVGSVSFNVRVGATVGGTTSGENTASIRIPATGTGASTGAPSLPYPSPITISGVAGTVVSVTATLNGFSHTFPSDVDVLLVGPAGHRLMLMSDVGGGTDAVNTRLTFRDGAPAVGTTVVSGTYRPTNPGTLNDPFPAPAPAGPYGSTFAQFNGTNPNGVWSLYIVDDVVTDVGSVSGGWSLNIDTADPSCAVVNAPQITEATTSQSALWPPNHTMRDVAVNYTTGTDCALCSLSVVSNEPINGTGDGDTSPDWEVVDNRNVRLRAERAGNGTGRIYSVTITCTNGAGTSVQTVPVHVAHNITSPRAGTSVRINTPVSFAGSFWDHAARRHTASWTFNNLSSPGAVSEPSGSRLGTVLGNYSFAEPGVYRVSMNVTDDRNVTASVSNAGDAEAILVVYDPSGGFVVGGGWFQSSGGSMTFGYNSKYHANGKNVKGDARMTFTAGADTFIANRIDYLTINGARAQIGGSGTLNGNGPYDFLLSMIDGTPDLVRVKIWQKNTGQVVFDSQPGASDAADPTTTVGESSSVMIQK